MVPLALGHGLIHVLPGRFSRDRLAIDLMGVNRLLGDIFSHVQ
jgi:hypothetical protein